MVKKNEAPHPSRSTFYTISINLCITKFAHAEVGATVTFWKVCVARVILACPAKDPIWKTKRHNVKQLHTSVKQEIRQYVTWRHGHLWRHIALANAAF